MNTEAHANKSRRLDIRRWLWPSLVLGVFLLALGIRVLKAISFQFLIDPDIGITFTSPCSHRNMNRLDILEVTF